MNKTKIEWADSTWNPTTGCTKISAGCKNCYAEKMAIRLKAMGQQKYKNGFKLTLHPEILEKPYSWKKSRTVFVNSMSDLFHEDIPPEFIKKVFKVMNDNRNHIFQVLTKRADILLEYNKKLEWSPNIWMGVTVENQDNVSRIDHLRETDAAIKFLSIEPLIGEINAIHLNNIDWVIVGGESGIGARLMKKDWVIPIKKCCLKKNIPFFFKQWGGVNKKKTGRLLEGKTYDASPKKNLHG